MAAEITNKMEALTIGTPSKKFYTAMENCLVTRPDNTPPYTSFMERPVYDVYAYYDPLRAEHYFADGSFIWWSRSLEYVKWVQADGTLTEWFERPTIQTIVDKSLTNMSDSRFTKFNKDGSVFEHGAYGDWFWGPQTIECEPYSIDEVDDDSYSDDCGCHNDYRCCGWYPHTEDRF
jgi:hypothetical protein